MGQVVAVVIWGHMMVLGRYRRLGYVKRMRVVKVEMGMGIGTSDRISHPYRQ